MTLLNILSIVVLLAGIAAAAGAVLLVAAVISWARRAYAGDEIHP